MAEQLEQTKHPGGRPRLTFDLRQVEDLGKIQSTHAELAAVLGCGLSTVKDRLANDDEFSAAYERGREAGKSSLRRIQWKAALAGNVVMQIWLGKQYLGQRDERALAVTQEDGDTRFWGPPLLTDEGMEANNRLLRMIPCTSQWCAEQHRQVIEGEVIEYPALPAPEPASQKGTA